MPLTEAEKKVFAYLRRKKDREYARLRRDKDRKKQYGERSTRKDKSTKTLKKRASRTKL